MNWRKSRAGAPEAQLERPDAVGRQHHLAVVAPAKPRAHFAILYAHGKHANRLAWSLVSAFVNAAADFSLAGGRHPAVPDILRATSSTKTSQAQMEPLLLKQAPCL